MNANSPSNRRSFSPWALVLIAVLVVAAGIFMFRGTSSPQEEQGSAEIGSSVEGGSGEASTRAATGLTMHAEQGTDTLEITRTTYAGTQPSNMAEDSWTILVYLCGSDLESQNAAASQDLREMLAGNGSENVRFVVETGGARTWKNNTVKTNQLGRYLIQGDSIQEVGSLRPASMGEASTLADFVTWGVQNYPSEHMGLILWDHGGGSISGVCFDELNRRDSLFLREIDTALNQAYAVMWDKFDFVGFDACLMSTLETANVLASYADYMVASQESEPGSGWEYSSIVRFLTQNPDADGNALGRAICDGYLESVSTDSKGFITLSVVDLSKIDNLLQSYYRFSQEIYESGADQSTLTMISRNINQVDNYGCNNRREGYTNMVDLGGLATACEGFTTSSSAVQQALYDAITYQIRGNLHADATGLSTYYPLYVNGKTELSIFETIAVNPSYLSYIDRLVHEATYGSSQYDSYSSSSSSIWGNGLWDWIIGNSAETQTQAIENWNYVDDHQDGTTQITFAEEPQVDDEGTLWFQLDEAGLNKTAVVSGIVYQYSDDGKNLIVLGETYDIYGNWETGEFSDGFDGKWLSLPNGENLNLAVESSTSEYILYASPIERNGEECFLRLRQNIADGSVVVEGVWNAVGENGAIDRSTSPLEEGDVIVPLYSAISAAESTDANDYAGDEYTVPASGLTINYEQLSEGTYLYGFCIQDAFGDRFYTPCAEFEVDSAGDIYF